MNNVHNLNHLPIDPSLGRVDSKGGSANQPARTGRTEDTPFRRILGDELRPKQKLTFSAHAQDRLRSRNIQLNPEAMERLHRAVDAAEAKGAKDALVLMSGSSSSVDLAMVVSVTNRTVITAMDGETIRDNVFTNIDSAVVA